jgi:hypothetical protein
MFLSVELNFRRPIYLAVYVLAKLFQSIPTPTSIPLSARGRLDSLYGTEKFLGSA